MAEKQIQRRLATIMSADVAGYSRLMEHDEAGTFQNLKAIRKKLIEPEVKKHHGRIFKLMGDGFLVEFGSVVDAVECAASIQKNLSARNAALEENQRINLRIGVTLGEVIVDGEDRFGDGVNIAARLQQMAEPGGINLSGKIASEIKSKLPIRFEPLGKQKVKNIDEPIEIYRVIDETIARGFTRAKHVTPARWKAAALLTGVLLIGMGAAVGGWWRPWETHVETSSMAPTALPLPDKPSIAVLPFANMSDDPKQEYFADGMTDDLITELSQVSGLFVIARNSTFVYKGKTVPPEQVSKELGVRYLLEGSIQKAGDQLRINAQLIDALSGGHVWAEKIDGSLTDVFALQDKVTRRIAEALALRLTPQEQRILAQRETSVPAAYDAFLRGWEHHRRNTPEDLETAISYFSKAIDLDPHYGRAYAAAAMTYARFYVWRWHYKLNITKRETRARAVQFLRMAQKYKTALAHQVAGFLLETDWEHTPAIAELKEAIALDPGESWGYAFMAFTLTSAGRPAEAIPHIQTALRLDPHPPNFFMYVLALTEFSLEDFEAAAAAAEASIKINPDDESAFLLLAATNGHLGRKHDAELAITQYNVLRGSRGDAPVTISSSPPLDLSKQKDSMRLYQGLRLAGVPESLSNDQFTKNRLTVDDIRSLFLGHQLRGRTSDSGERHDVTVTLNGVATLTGDWASSGGRKMSGSKMEFKNNELCFVWMDTVTQCGAVYRNPIGQRAKENEFIWYHGTQAFTFSQVM